MTKKMMGIVLICSMMMVLFAPIGSFGGTSALAASFSTGVAVEAEAGVLGNEMTVYASPTAGGGNCISTEFGNTLADPQNLPVPDATYTFNITKADYYKVYLRCYPYGSSNSYYYRWDAASTYTVKYATSTTDWSWTETSSQYLTVGTHTLDICHRVSRFYIDLIVVSNSFTTAQKNQIDADILANVGGGNTSTAVDFTTSSGSVMFEAEQTTLDPSLFGTVSDSSAAGGSGVSALVNQASIPADGAGAEFNITTDRSTAYDVWIRYSAASGQNSLYLSQDGSDYALVTLNVTGTNPSAYGWMKIATTKTLFSGSRYGFKLYPAKAGLRIDKLILTTYPFFNPSGQVDNLQDLHSTYTLPSGVYPAPAVTPPPAHPSLCFKESDIATIKANMTKPQNSGALSQYNTYLASDVDGRLPPVAVPASANYNSTVLATIEAYALKYALDKDVTYGNKAILAMKNYFNTAQLNDEIPDISRTMGHTIYVASVVYDWCYPLLTDADKDFLIVAAESMAKRMEVGYPPNKQGAVSGHGGEAQLFRDMASFGIATYNERPDIYNYAVGRLLSEYVPTRDYWFASNTHHQGDSYSSYRHIWEIFFQYIMHRMSGQTVFAPQMEHVPDQWIYTRRPDGQQFRNGDSGQDRGSVIGTYWNADVNATMLSGNFYDNPYVKNLHLAGNPNKNSFTVEFGFMTPSAYLIFNNPDLAGQSHATVFPLSKYFGSPYGMMIARTGWTEPGQANVNLNSNIAMAQMQIGEQWAANHEHLDVGSFQLYYKGPLAIDSGVYDDYGSSHDKNYHKETIAHNSLLIKDPNETFYGGAVNSGGQRRPGGELNTFQAWMSSGYDMGKVLDHQYDEGHTLPQYTYIKGDITRAYSNKVSEVLRSMLFLPLEDASHPAALVVMDKVTSTNAAFKKTWLLHTQQEPTISGNTAMVKRDTNGYNGRMDVTALLPQDAALTKIGGAGKEFSINGVNYPPSTYGSNGCEYGAWRIEASPGSANATDYFLNVMQVSDASANVTPLATALIQTNVVAGVKISNRVAVFGKNKDRMSGPITFTVPGTETSGLKIMVAGVKEGTWNIYKGASLVTTAAATTDGGTLYVEGGAGEYVLLHNDTEMAASLLSLAYDGSGNILGSGEFDYTISLPRGTVSAPTVTAIPADSTAHVVITQAVGVPGTATVVVTSADGQTVHTYTLSFTTPDLGDATLQALSYSLNGQTQSISIDSTNRFKAYLPYGTKVMPVVSAVPVYSGAVVDIVQPTAFPGESKITVASANGEQTKTYYLRFTYTPGNITNVKNNLSTKTYPAFSDLRPQSLAELRELFGDVGSLWEQYCRCFMDRSFTAVSAVLGGSNIPSDTTLTQIPSGQSWFYMWIAKGTNNGDTSSCFNGASWITTSNSDFRAESLSPYLLTNNGDAITFHINQAATVWVAMKISADYTNFASKGWTKVTSAQGYKVVHGDGGLYSNFYKKDFAPGTVEIPCLGEGAYLPDRAFIPIIVWKDNNYGDVDADGVIDISDVIMAAEIAVGNGDGYNADQVRRANVSDKSDMAVDISDVVLIAERAVGDTTPFPVELIP